MRLIILLWTAMLSFNVLADDAYTCYDLGVITEEQMDKAEAMGVASNEYESCEVISDLTSEE